MKTTRISRRKFIGSTAIASGMASFAPFGFAYGPSLKEQTGNRSAGEVWIAGISQMWLRSETAERMVDEILNLLKDVESFQPDFVCLPEVFPFAMTQKKYRMNEMIEISEKVIDLFSGFSRRNKCYTVCPVYITNEGKNYNSAVFIDRQGGKIGLYDKIHPTIEEIDGGNEMKEHPLKIEFEAIIKEVKSRVTVTNDKVYRIILETDNNHLIEAGAWPSNETVRVSMERNTYHGLGDTRG